MDDLKAEYKELYFATADYTPDQGEPKYNRIYYTSMEEREGESVKCLDFYVYDRKVVKIENNYRDYWKLKISLPKKAISTMAESPRSLPIKPERQKPS